MGVLSKTKTRWLNVLSQNLKHEYTSLNTYSAFQGHLNQPTVLHTLDGLLLSQSKYILDILQKINMHESKAVHTPMSSTQML